MNTHNIFLCRNWDEFEIDAIPFNAQRISNLSLTGQIDVTGQSIPMGILEFDLCTDMDLSGCKWLIYEFIDEDHESTVCKWIIKNIKSIDDKHVRVTAEPFLALLNGIAMNDTMVETNTYGMEDIRLSILPANPYGGFDEDWNNLDVTGYLPSQTARDRMVWIIFGSGLFFSSYGCLKIIEGWNVPRTGDTYFTRMSIPNNAELIDSRITFRETTFSFRDRVKGITLTSYDFNRAESLLVDGDDYRFPEPWIALTMEHRGVIPSEDDGDIQIGENVENEENPANIDRAREIIIDNIYTVTSGNAINIMGRLKEYYMNPRELNVDVINPYEYCAGERVMVYAAADKLVSGIIEQADYIAERRIRSKLKLVCVTDVPGVWLTINYSVSGNIIGHDRKYLPADKAYTIRNYPIIRCQNDRIITYAPSQTTTTGVMGNTDAEINVQYVASRKAWLIINFTHNGNIVGIRRRYLSVGEEYAFYDTINYYIDGVGISYIPLEGIIGTMGDTDTYITVPCREVIE